MTTVAALAVLLVLSLVAPVVAAPLTMGRDRSDNTYYFDYDPATGDIGAESSSMILKARDPVAFLVYIRKSPGAAEGDRLKAAFSLTLNRKRVVRYDGTFSLVVRDAAGVVVLREAIQRKVVLRPQSGQRRARFSIPFDLAAPGLNYEAKAVFKSS